MTPYEIYTKYLFAKADHQGIPLSGTFELTARCNLDCRMCYIHRRANDAAAQKQEMTAEQWLSLAADCQRAGMLILLLTGGEPFLRPDFGEIYSGCRKLGFMVSINTNGTLITPEWVEFLTSDPPARMNITLYGASRETYAALCGDGTAYDRAVKAILQLKAAGIPVKLNYSVTPYNRQDAERIYTFAKEHQLAIQTAAYMFPPVRACENGACTTERLTPEQAGRARWEYDRFRFSEEELAQRTTHMLAGDAVQDPDRECQELPTERIRCRAGAATFWITYSGQMRPCGMMKIPSIDIRETGWEKSWEWIRQEREKILLPAKCTACRWKNVCEFCPATCYAENGTFEQAPEYICRKMEAYLAAGKNWLAEKNLG